MLIWLGCCSKCLVSISNDFLRSTVFLLCFVTRLFFIWCFQAINTYFINEKTAVTLCFVCHPCLQMKLNCNLQWSEVNIYPRQKKRRKFLSEKMSQRGPFYFERKGIAGRIRSNSYRFDVQLSSDQDPSYIGIVMSHYKDPCRPSSIL